MVTLSLKGSAAHRHVTNLDDLVVVGRRLERIRVDAGNLLQPKRKEHQLSTNTKMSMWALRGVMT